jgi:hypothetical protein
LEIRRGVSRRGEHGATARCMTHPAKTRPNG